MKIDRRRLARAIAVAVIGIFLTGGIIYVGRDVTVRPPVETALQEPAPADTAAPRTHAAKLHSEKKKKEKNEKDKKHTRRPIQRDFLNEPVNR